jgi:uncharacterized membrane protein YecN with MAPEG domain
MAAGVRSLEREPPIANFARVASASGACDLCGSGRKGEQEMPSGMVLPITLTMAGAATLVNMWLGRRVGQMRIAHKVSVGDGGNEAVVRRMRAQANFVEYTPFFLILLGLIELATGSLLWLWAVGALYLIARLLHAFGMDSRTSMRLRMIGIAGTGLILFGLAVYALVIPYLAQPKAGSTVSGVRPA